MCQNPTGGKCQLITHFYFQNPNDSNSLLQQTCPVASVLPQRDEEAF